MMIISFIVIKNVKKVFMIFVKVMVLLCDIKNQNLIKQTEYIFLGVFWGNIETVKMVTDI